MRGVKAAGRERSAALLKAIRAASDYPRRSRGAPGTPAPSPGTPGRLPGIWIPAAPDEARDSGRGGPEAPSPRPPPRPPADWLGPPPSGPVELPNFMSFGKVTTTGCPGALGNWIVCGKCGGCGRGGRATFSTQPLDHYGRGDAASSDNEAGAFLGIRPGTRGGARAQSVLYKTRSSDADEPADSRYTAGVQNRAKRCAAHRLRLCCIILKICARGGPPDSPRSSIIRPGSLLCVRMEGYRSERGLQARRWNLA